MFRMLPPACVNTSVATINSTGLAFAVGLGTTTVHAASGSVTGSTTLTVRRRKGG